MRKTKLSGFAIACIVGLVGLFPVSTFAAETNTESVTLSEKDKSQKENRAAFDEKMRIANEKWNTLSAKQKNEVYALLESKLKEENRLMDKLVELGVMEKVDADTLKAHMSENFNKVKASGEFPLLRKKCNNKSK